MTSGLVREARSKIVRVVTGSAGGSSVVDPTPPAESVRPRTTTDQAAPGKAPSLTRA